MAKQIAVIVAVGGLMGSVQVRQAPGQAVELGPEVIASVNDDGGALRVEPSVAVAGHLVVVSWNDSWAGREAGARVGVAVGWSYSLDGGQSFRFGGYLPVIGEVATVAAADSWLEYDGHGTIFLQILHWPNEGDHQIRVYAMDVRRPPAFEFRGIAALGPGLDKPAFTVGPGGELVSAYTDDGRIGVVRSRDGGRSWDGPVTVSDTTSGVRRSGVDVTICAGRTVVGWGEPDGIRAAADPGDGSGFGPARIVGPLKGPVPVPEGYSLGLGPMNEIPNNVYLGCRPDPVGDDRVFLAYVQRVGDDGEHESRAVVQSAVVRRGTLAWSEPSWASAASGRWQAFPALDVTPSGVGIVYYDWRDADDGVGTAVYATLRDEENVRDVRLTDAPTDWTALPGDREFAVVQRNVGDYISLDGDGSTWIAAWTDGRRSHSEIRVRRLTSGP